MSESTISIGQDGDGITLAIIQRLTPFEAVTVGTELLRYGVGRLQAMGLPLAGIAGAAAATAPADATPAATDDSAKRRRGRPPKSEPTESPSQSAATGTSEANVEDAGAPQNGADDQRPTPEQAAALDAALRAPAEATPTFQPEATASREIELPDADSPWAPIRARWPDADPGFHDAVMTAILSGEFGVTKVSDLRAVGLEKLLRLVSDPAYLNYRASTIRGLPPWAGKASAALAETSASVTPDDRIPAF